METNEQELKKHRCSIAGHRPEKLKASQDDVKEALEREILKAIDEGYVTFITGMERGTDIWAADIVILLKDMGYKIHLICAVPYFGVEKCWSQHWQQKYWRVLSRADRVKFISDAYTDTNMFIRVHWMIDHSSKLIAVFNGTFGGTRGTIAYAKYRELSCSIIEA